MKKKTFPRSIVTVALVAALAVSVPLMTPLPATAFFGGGGRATKWMQILQRAEAIKQLAQQVQMVKNQILMLKNLAGSVKGALSGFNGEISSVFGQTQDILRRAEGLTIASDDLMKRFGERHWDPLDPKYKEYTDIRATNRYRANEWKKSQEAHMKSLGVTAQAAKNEEKQRLEMLKAMQGAEGQLQALQVMGHMLTETNQLLARQHRDMTALMSLMAERERDKIDEELEKQKRLEDSFAEFGKSQREPAGYRHTK